MRTRNITAPVTLWRTVLVLLWCAVFVFAAILIGEYTGLIDSATGEPGAAVHADQPGSERDCGSGALTPTPNAQPLAQATLGAAAAQPSAETCTPGRPVFVHGAATLKATLGPTMGDPRVRARHRASGDTEQRTTMGLVYYRRRRTRSRSPTASTTGRWRRAAWCTGRATRSNSLPASAEPFG